MVGRMSVNIASDWNESYKDMSPKKEPAHKEDY